MNAMIDQPTAASARIRVLYDAATSATASHTQAAKKVEEAILAAIAEHGTQDAAHQALILDHLRALDELCAKVGVTPDFCGNAKLTKAYEKMGAEPPEVFFPRALPALERIRAAIWQET